ncbi:hypothetical protein [Candidatus Amarobacter glycogenicus]|uniref:hypothetical protein n=1 Tax=Candidatus Amarobacter glycogenicus TaxID=3140699 RepID=UPI002A11AC66|nr:hypothetical protein [Dehalococcoidia bacterium]
MDSKPFDIASLAAKVRRSRQTGIKNQQDMPLRLAIGDWRFNPDCLAKLIYRRERRESAEFAPEKVSASSALSAVKI